MPTALSDEDLRAAVAAGIVTEAQAARVVTLAQLRAGTRAALTGEDEPFELFRGFAEVFISVGLVILISGITAMSALTGLHPLGLPVISAVLAALFAWYFSLKRRMVLPSIVLTVGFAMAFSMIVGIGVFGDLMAIPGRNQVLLAGGLMIAALLIWFRVFNIPFTMLLVGLTALATLQFAISPLAPLVALNNWQLIFDLNAGSRLAVGTFVFGLAAFAVGMWFDMRDPHRLGRYSASGFWLHVLAAPALVNTLALTFLGMDSLIGYSLLALSLLLVTIMALIIDRRSFLTAGIAYIGILLGLVLRPDQSAMNAAGLLIVLGAFVTVTGAFWTAWRSAILRALPEFPGKSRLPPYGA